MNFGVNADLAQKNEPNNLNSECANILVSSTRTHRHPYKSARSTYAWNTHTHVNGEAFHDVGEKKTQSGN